MSRVSHFASFVLACAPLVAQSPQQPQQQQQPPSTSPADVPPQQTAPKGLAFKVGTFDVKLGGYIKVDAIHDFDEIGSTDSFDPRTIPTDDETDPGVNTRLHARQTRINLDVRGPLENDTNIRLFVEGDFFGDGNAFRMRHAYGVYEGLLAGQTWSTFMDEDAMPETLDFESPIAFPLIRQAQIRYRSDFGERGGYWAVAIEDPASRIVLPAVPGEQEEATPDLTARLRLPFERGHFQLSGFAGTARFDADTAPADTILIYGFNASTKLDVFERDKVYAQATWGPGVGRYRGGTTAAPDAAGELEPITVLAAMLGYEHHWSDEWRSTVTISAGDGDLPAATPPDNVEVLSYAAANLIWQFSSRAWTGVEYLYGSREDNDGERGEAHRIQFSVRFDF